MQHEGMTMPSDSAMPGMAQGGMQMDGGMLQRMMEMHMRMLQDPVIRERIATDPVLQQMMRDAPDMMQMMQSGRSMPMGGTQGAAAETTIEADRSEAMEFIVRLLADPEVASRVHSDPELHQLWSDPEVQARLSELQQTHPQQVQPAQPAVHDH
jgi:hypothetical protein